MDHQLTFHPNARAFVQAAAPYLESREERYGLLLGLARRFAETDESDAEYVFATAKEEGTTVGAILRSPGHKVLLSDLPEPWITPAAAQIAGRLSDAPGVQGEKRRAQVFAEAWKSHQDVSVLAGRAQRLYVLRELVAPRPASGTSRRATAADEPLLQRWVRAFMADVGSPQSDFHPGYIQGMLDRNAIVLWEDEGRPVSSAASSRDTPLGASVSLVYTPDDCRGRGYASNVTAQLSRELLAGGKTFTTLYTERANPVTNSIYQQIGYRAVADEIELWFDAGTGTSHAQL